MNSPIEIHPGLSEDRLVAVGQLIREARHRAVGSHRPGAGDNEWVLGCRAYTWVCVDITLATATNPWLTIVEGGLMTEDGRAKVELHFVFAVGGVPLRFYRGDADDVPTRSLRRNFPELVSQQTAFDFASAPKPDSILRLAVETNEFGEVTNILLVQVDREGVPLGKPWTVPDVPQPSKVTRFRRKEEGKELGQPTVETRQTPAKEQEPEE
jgi:hypothetical protein